MKVSVFLTRQEDMRTFFAEVDSLCFCTDIDRWFLPLVCQHDPQQLSLFIGASLLSQTAFLLHHGKFPPYDNIPLLFTHIEYKNYNWNICSGTAIWNATRIYKVQLLHLWIFIFSRAKAYHYIKENSYWLLLKVLGCKAQHCNKQAFVDTSKIFLLPLYIKIGLIGNFVKALNKEDEGFQYFRTIFPKITNETDQCWPNIVGLWNDISCWVQTKLSSKTFLARLS